MKQLAIIATLLLLAATSCDTRRDIYQDRGVWVRVRLDWSESGLSPQRATVAFYPTQAGQQPVFLQTNATYDSVLLNRGGYRVVAINETFGSFERILVRGTNLFETLEAYVPTYANTVARVDGPYSLIPDTLAVDRCSNFEVTRSMWTSHARPLIELTPRRVTVPLHLIVHVQGIDNAAAAGSTATIDGIAEGVLIAAHSPTAIPVSHITRLNERIYDEGSYQNGRLFSHYNTFDQATTASPTHRVWLRFALRNNETFGVERDVTHLLRRINGTWGKELVIEIGTGTADDPPIILPEVPDATDPGAGFDAIIDDWGDEELIDIIL